MLLNYTNLFAWPIEIFYFDFYSLSSLLYYIELFI